MATSHTHRQIYKALEAKSLRSRSLSTLIADHLTIWTSKPAFLYLNAAFFVIWIVVNLGLVPAILPFDPYPFGFLTMVVSLEAIFLSVFVLISQNRAAQIATLREELHLRLNLIAEQEITKSLEILLKMQKKMGIYEKDEELERMLEMVNPTDLETSIQHQLLCADKSLVRTFIGDLSDVLTPGQHKKDVQKN